MLINKKENIFEDNIAYIEQYDFSYGNLSEENRIKVVTQVASICYNSENKIGSEVLYNKLKAESIGLPSSSFEFVPVLLNSEKINILKNILYKNNKTYHILNVEKFGEYIVENKQNYLLTNLRALLNDYYELKEILDSNDLNIIQWFNSKKESEIIKKHFKVFKSKIDLPTRTQYIRHRVSWQELSRRYVSDRKKPFEYYISPNIVLLPKEHFTILDENKNPIFDGSYIELLKINTTVYQELTKQNIKAEEARRIIPQAAYTELWSAWQPKQLENFFKLRLDSHAQIEIRKLALAKKELIYDC